MSSRLRAYSQLLTAVIIWAVAAVIIKVIFQKMEPLPFLTYRFFLSFLLSIFLIKKTHIKINYDAKTLLYILLFCLFSTTFSLGFLFVGLNKTTVLNLSLLSLIGPIITIWAGVFFLKEHITKKEKIGALIAFFGTILTILEPVLQSKNGLGSLEGNLLILIYILFDTASIILLKKLIKKDISPQNLTNVSFVIGFLTLLPITLFLYPPETLVKSVLNLPILYHAGVWYMAIFSGTIAYTLRAKAQKTIKVEQSSLFGYLGSLIIAPLALIFLGETITPLFAIGGAFVVLGLLVAETHKIHFKT